MSLWNLTISEAPFVDNNEGGLPYVWAWSGGSAPDITKIPAGVTVTYQNVEYVGTLEPSGQTEGKMYIVYNGNETDAYDEYNTLEKNGQYLWNHIGTAQITIQGLLSFAEEQSLTPEQILRVLSNAHAAKAPEVSATLPATLADGTEYRLGSVSSLSIVLPAMSSMTESYGIVVSFTASAAFTTTVTGTTAGASIPETVSGKKYRFLFDWDGAAWVVSYVTYS